MPIPNFTPPRDNIDTATTASVWTPLNQTVGYMNSHMAGQVPGNGVTRHDDTQIDINVALAEVSGPNQAPATQRIYNDSTWAMLTKLLGNYSGTHFMDKMASITDTIFGLAGLLRSHTHADNSHGGLLTWLYTHQPVSGSQYADADLSTNAIHHTLGTGSTQAAAGDHLHDTRYARLTSAGVASGYATLDATGVVPDTQIPSTIARDAEVAAAYIPLSQRAAASGVATLDTGTKVPIVQLPDLSASYVNVSQKAAASGVATLDGTTHIPDAQIGSNVARQADVTTAVAGRSVYQHVHGGPGGELAIDGDKGIAPFSITSINLLEGAVKPRTPNDSWVTVNAIRKWDINGNFINYQGEDVNLAGLFPAAGSGQSCYILIYVNSQPAARARQGPLYQGSINNAAFPTVGANETPLAFVLATAGMTTVGQQNLMGCRFLVADPNLQSGGGGSGSFAPLNHVHGQNNTSFITSFSLDEGRCYAFGTPTMSIDVSPFHYRGSDNIVRKTALQVQNADPTKPSTNNYRNDLVYWDIVNKVLTIQRGTEFSNLLNPTYPAAQANWMTLCYIHMTWNMTVIKDTDDGQNNGWIEDARMWANVGGPMTVASGAIDVGSGGTGQNGFSQGLVWQSSATVSTTPLTTIPATAVSSGPTTYGLGVTPVIPTGTAVGGEADTIQLGGGTVNTGGNALAMIAGVRIVPPVKSGAGQTTTGAALHVDAPNLATTTNNLSMQVDGPSLLQGKVSVGAMPPVNTMMNVAGTVASATPVGSQVITTVQPASAAAAYGMYVSPAIDTSVANATQAYGIYAGPMSKPSSSNQITEMYAIYGQAPTVGVNRNYAGYFAGGLASTGVTAFPIVASIGECCYRSDLRSWWMYGSNGWRSMEAGMFTAAEGFPSGAPQGARAYIFDWHSEFMWDGGAWSQMGVPFINGTLGTSPAPPSGTRYTNGGDGKTYRWTGTAWVPMGRILLGSVAGGGDLWNGAVTGASTFNAFNTVSGTITDANSQIEIQLSVGLTINNGGTVNNILTCVQVDSGTRYNFGASNSVAANAVGVPTPSGGIIPITNPGVGAHTFSAQLYTQASATLFGRFGSAPGIEFCRTSVWENHL